MHKLWNLLLVKASLFGYNTIDMQKAIIKVQGSQYLVGKDQKILVDKLKDPKKIDFQVILVTDGERTEIGTPYIEKHNVQLSVLDEEVQGDKIYVQTYKAKSRYRRKIGFRPKYSQLLVKKV